MATTRAAAKKIRVWEDDPMSTGATPVERPVPKLPVGKMKIAVDGTAPPAKAYEPGTPEFRYWVAVDALKRAGGFWSGVLPKGTTWQRGTTLPVMLDAGDKLNALYNRNALVFFHATVEGTTIFTGESPDVIAHELGHAVLDAIKPQLWDAMSHEVAAFHESFGDISAILSALQLPSVRDRAVVETAGVYRASRLSRVAEQLGWGVRQRQPCSVDPDCLRNAVNCFAYQPPDKLPLIAPASSLSSAPHSFSRVFTASFFEAFAGMMVTLGLPATSDKLLQASQDAARLLVTAVQMAPVVPAFLSQVAAHLLEADRTLFAGKYANALQYGMLARGVLSPASVGVRATPALSVAAATPTARSVAAAAARNPAELPLATLSARDFGLGDRPLLVRAAAEPSRLAVNAVSLDGTPATPPSGEQAAHAFVSELVMRDRLRLPRMEDDEFGDPVLPLRTHEVVEQGDTLVLVRKLFDAPCSLLTRGRGMSAG